jgi:hypothetical protein
MRKVLKVLGITVLTATVVVFVWQKYPQPQVDKRLLEEPQWFAYFEWVTPATNGCPETIEVCYLSDRIVQCYRIIGSQVRAYRMTSSDFKTCTDPVNYVYSCVFRAVQYGLENRKDWMPKAEPLQWSFQHARLYAYEKGGLFYDRIVKERAWNGDEEDIHRSLVELHQAVCKFLTTWDYWEPHPAFVRLMPLSDDFATAHFSQVPETGGAGYPEWYHFRQRDILKITISPFILFPIARGINPFQHMGLEPSFGDRVVVKSQTLHFSPRLFTVELFSGETDVDVNDYQQGMRLPAKAIERHLKRKEREQ